MEDLSNIVISNFGDIHKIADILGISVGGVYFRLNKNPRAKQIYTDLRLKSKEDMRNLSHKRCNRCNADKDINEFGIDNRNGTGRKSWCRACHNKYHSDYRMSKMNVEERQSVEIFRGKVARNKVFKGDAKLKAKDSLLRRKYNITYFEWLTIIEKQKGKCAICEIDLDLNKDANVDHDHATGKIRGILCSFCNRALGLLKDDPSIIMKAYEYINISLLVNS